MISVCFFSLVVLYPDNADMSATEQSELIEAMLMTARGGNDSSPKYRSVRYSGMAAKFPSNECPA